MENPEVRVLLIEDDEDDYVLIRDLLEEVSSTRYDLDWVSDAGRGLDKLRGGRHDVCLLDHMLGELTGLELLDQAGGNHCSTPVIFLTGQDNYSLDMQAMKRGASDYLVKGHISAPLLERSIRYSIEHRKTAEALRKSEKELKYLSSRLLSYQENERKMIAARLHDELGQILTAVKLGVEDAIGLMPEGESCTRLKSLLPSIQDGIDEVRNLYTRLRPSLLDDLGIGATIHWYCRQFKELHPEIRIEAQIDILEDRIPSSVKDAIFRIVQEALGNVSRHSSAGRVHLSLLEIDGNIVLTVQDNGLGFDIDAALPEDDRARGLGFLSMKERTELFGGTLKIDSTRGSGTTITASWTN